jgi:FkbM family methyltransferase
MRLLVANFFPAHFPPRSGGEQRYYYLYKHLSEWHDVTLLSADYSDRPIEYVEHSSSFREYRVPKPAVSESLHRELYEAGIGDECSALVVALCGAADGALRSRLRDLVQYADAVVHESPFTFALDDTAHTDGKPRIYASYNVEHRLAAQMLKGPAGEAATRFIRFIEGLLASRADLVFATSREEAEAFREDFGIDSAKVRLAPNGFEPWEDAQPGSVRDAQAAPFAVFIGSGHPPNVEAARFICEGIAPHVPALRFLVMGAVCGKLPSPAAPNVELLGFVEEGRMRRLLRDCTVALNPLFSGAGTNLKMLQYMEAAAPIVSTPVGARGLDLQPGIEAVIVEPDDFVQALHAVAADTPAYRLIGEAAHRKAHSAYSWRQIAERYSSALQELPLTVSRGERPTLLHVNDYPVAVGGGGGHVRIRELLRELAVDFDLQLLCLTDDSAACDARIAEGAWQRAFPKTREHREAERLADEGQVVSVRDIAAAEWILANDAFMSAFRAALPHVCGVVFEHPYLAPLARLLPEHVPVVYASHNVERELKERSLRARVDGAAWAQRAAALERELCERASAIVCVCPDDERSFRTSYPDKRVIVVENGVHMPAPGLGASPSPRAGAVFVGSAHPPNISAVRFILETLAPAVPSIDFHIVGAVCAAVSHVAPPANVVLHGVLDADEKLRVQRLCAIGVNPMTEGGGSSLKVPDLLASGLALLSTAVGARGFGLRPDVDYAEAALDDFPARLLALARDPEQCARLARSGREAAQRVAWPALGARYRRVMRSIVRRRPGDKVRLLVATYRLQQPAPGGAESYLNELLSRLGSRGDVTIDVAACDVGSIQDHWHFSARYGAPPAGQGTPAGVARVFRFPIEAPDPDAFAKCRELHAAWMRESCAQAEMLFDGMSQPILLGGWNLPEQSGDAVWRWSGLRAQVGVPSGMEGIRVEGTSQGKQRLSLARGSEVLAVQEVSGSFSIEAPLSGAREIVELRVERPVLPVDDPRELGVSVQRISVAHAAGWKEVDIRDDAEMQVKRSHPGRWIESLIEATWDRDGAVDDLFLQVRGPHSRAMAAWLEDHVHEYDALLVQGTPFAPIEWVPPIARSRGVAAALLPHFHVEDRYYHWRSFYEAFRNADCVLVAPDSVKAAFFDRIDAAAETVPGGGIDLAEFSAERLERARGEFEAVHAGTRPFALVLGRKTGGKRYQLVLQAAALPGADFGVVMIGPDGDGLPVQGEDVTYYGARSRDFVLGALCRCACLVNMSESESFGIVLVEAWAVGRPVVAQRRCVAFTDLVVDGENGRLVETPEEIRDAVNLYVRDTRLARQHGEEGRRRARQLSWDALAARVHAAVVRKMLRGEAMATHIDFAGELDAASFAAGAAAQTLGQLRAAQVHDADFEAFRAWAGGEVRCILDIGANRGQSAASLHVSFPEAAIHCFEANPIFFPVLDEVAAAIGPRCRIHPYGLGRRTGEFSLYIPWAGGRPWLEESSTRLGYYELPWVAAKFAERGRLTLQEVRAQIREGDALGLEPQLIKIDVEGAENEVLLGLTETIRKCRPMLLVENSDWARVTHTLGAMGYRPYRWDAQSLRFVEFSGATTNTFYLHTVAHARLPAGAAHRGALA